MCECRFSLACDVHRYSCLHVQSKHELYNLVKELERYIVHQVIITQPQSLYMGCHNMNDIITF